MNYLLILNDPPYGTERSYNGLRLASALGKDDQNSVSVGKIGVCGPCMGARGLKPAALAQGAHRSSMEELSCWTQEADRVIVF